MKGNRIITIGREYGSGGREIGKQLAKALGVKFYDNELLDLAAKKSGLSKEVIKKADETATNSFLYSIATGAYLYGNQLASSFELPINDKLFIAQSEVIKQIAAKESAVIVGRCADYILRDHPNCVNIFIHATLEERIKRAVSTYHVPNEKVELKLKKIDKTRATYYNFYTNEKWGIAKNYHLTIDSGLLGIEGTAQFLANWISALDK